MQNTFRTLYWFQFTVYGELDVDTRIAHLRAVLGCMLLSWLPAQIMFLAPAKNISGILD
ncbi:hypothetical protein Plhal304r1_c051g0135001 [Plasmopara halstedii]